MSTISPTTEQWQDLVSKIPADPASILYGWDYVTNKPQSKMTLQRTPTQCVLYYGNVSRIGGATHTNLIINPATNQYAGTMTAADKIKLDNVATQLEGVQDLLETLTVGGGAQ